MCTRQKAGFSNNLTDGFSVTAINPHTRFQNGATHHIRFKVLDQSTNKSGVMIITNGVFRLVASESQCGLTFGFISNFVGRGKCLLKTFENFFDIFFLSWLFWQRAWFFCTRFRKVNNRINHRLDRVMTKIHRPKHDVFRQFQCFRFNHQNAFVCACHDKVKRSVLHLFNRGIQYISIIDPANSCRSNRPKKWHARQC